MRVLFDHNVPVGLRRFLSHHTIVTAAESGWTEVSNGRLLDAAETAGFEVMVTCDLNLTYQQNMKDRRLALVVLSAPAWPVVRENVVSIAAAVDRAAVGSYEEVTFSRLPLRRRPFAPPS